MADPAVRGRFVWYELLTTEPKAGEAFYRDVLAWATQKWGIGPFGYTMWTRGAMPFGGVVPLPSGAAARGAHWMPYIGAPDVNATTEQAQGLGAAVVVPPKDLPMVGRVAVLADPFGAVFAVFTPSITMPASGADPQPGDFSWHELVTTDREGAFRFYEALFGWERISASEMAPGEIYQEYGRGGRPLGGMFQASSPAPQWTLYVRVDDVARVAGLVVKNGGKLLGDPMDVPGGDRVVQCADAQGAVFALHQAKG